MYTYEVNFAAAFTEPATVEAKSFSLVTESDTYEFYNATNEKVFSTPRSMVLFVKRL